MNRVSPAVFLTTSFLAFIGVGCQVKPSLCLMPLSGTNISRICVNFGTADMARYGLRDSLTGDGATSSAY